MKLNTVELFKTYGEGEAMVTALKPCTLAIKSGEHIAITGASGSGKSTLLHLLGGLERPTGGQVLYDGEALSSNDDSCLAGFRLQNIGFVFQAYNLLPELTAYENIILPLMLACKQIDKLYLQSIVEDLDLAQRLEHLPGQLSGGQQQRVALARALINKPKLLLCDEPTGNLDSKSTMDVMELLDKTARNYSLTLLVVTHNREIAGMFPRIITLSDGVVGGDI